MNAREIYLYKLEYDCWTSAVEDIQNMSNRKWLSTIQVPATKSKKKSLASIHTVQPLYSIPDELVDVTKLRQTKVSSYFVRNRTSEVELLKRKLAKKPQSYHSFDNKGDCCLFKKTSFTVDDEEEKALFGTCGNSLLHANSTTIKEITPIKSAVNIIKKLSSEKKIEQQILQDVSTGSSGGKKQNVNTCNYDDIEQTFEDLSELSPCIVKVGKTMVCNVARDNVNLESTRMDQIRYDLFDLNDDCTPQCVNEETQDILAGALAKQNCEHNSQNSINGTSMLASALLNENDTQTSSDTFKSPSPLLFTKQYTKRTSTEEISVKIPTDCPEESPSSSFHPPSPLTFAQTFTECEDNTIHFRPPSPLVFAQTFTECEGNSTHLRPPSPLVFAQTFTEYEDNTIHFRPPSPLIFTKRYCTEVQSVMLDKELSITPNKSSMDLRNRFELDSDCRIQNSAKKTLDLLDKSTNVLSNQANDGKSKRVIPRNILQDITTTNGNISSSESYDGSCYSPSQGAYCKETILNYSKENVSSKVLQKRLLDAVDDFWDT